VIEQTTPRALAAGPGRSGDEDDRSAVVRADEDDRDSSPMEREMLKGTVLAQRRPSAPVVLATRPVLRVLTRPTWSEWANVSAFARPSIAESSPRLLSRRG
jgi:hypothetical protein